MITHKKILFVHSSAGLYGADRCLLSIVEGMVDRGAVVHVTVPEDGVLVEMLESAGAQVHFIDTVVFRREVLSIKGMIVMLLRAPVSIARIARLIRREGIELVHTNTGVTVGGAVAAKLCRVPHIWHFREILVEFRKYLRFYEPFVDFFSTRLIFITGAVRDHFSRERIRRKGVVIHDGVPIHEYESTAPEKTESPVVITTVGRLAPNKGQDVMIRALAEVARRGIDFQAYIVGDVYGDRHAFREGLEVLAKQLGVIERVHFTGFQDQVQPYLEHCNIFIMASTGKEGLGIVILEAMAAGRAVISTNSGGAVEILENNVTGLLVPPGDSERMADAIVDLAGNPDKRLDMARRGKQIALEKYSANAMVASVASLFDEVVNAGATGDAASGLNRAGLKKT